MFAVWVVIVIEEIYVLILTLYYYIIRYLIRAYKATIRM